jgi:RecA-family ATPase
VTWGAGEFFAAEDEAARERRAGAAAVASKNGHDPDWKAEPLAPVDPSTLADIPVPSRLWLVPDWVPMARPTGLYGAGGEGKTLLAQILATAAAIGWLGLSVLRCNSLLHFCEDDLDEMQRRQADINRSFGCTFADLGAMRWLPRLGHDNALMTFTDGRPRHTPLFGNLLAAAKEHKAKLIVTDTLADVFAGNENDRGQARAFAQQVLGLLARETQGAVIALAHPSRAGMNSGSGESGSTTWIGTFRSQLYLSTPKGAGDAEPPDPDLRILTRRKANAARRNETIELRWNDGVFRALSPPGGIIGAIERRTCERVFLDLLTRSISEGQHVTHNSRAGSYAPRVFALRPDKERFAKTDFERAMQALFAAGSIRVGQRKAADRKLYQCILADRIERRLAEAEASGVVIDNEPGDEE